MATIVTRAGKGSPLTHAEVDANFNNLNTEASAALPATGGTMTGDIDFGDNVKAIFGAGSDLQIYHDGFNSYITDSSGTGDLYIRGSNLRLTDSDGTLFLFGSNNADTRLYHSGNVRLSTTATGIDVTGTVTADGLTVSDAAPFINITDTDTGVDHQITGSSGVGNLSIKTDVNNEAADGDFFVNTKSANRIRVQGNGDISFYNTSGNAKFFWDASTQRLGIGTITPSAALDVVGAINVTDAATTRTNLDVDQAGTALALAIALG